MKSFGEFIIEADALRDKKVRLEASRVWNQLLRILKSNPQYLNKVPPSKDYEYAPQLIISGQTLQTNQYDDFVLSLIFTQKKYGYGGLFIDYRSTKVVRLIISEPISIKADSQDLSSARYTISAPDFFRVIKRYEVVFVHEFVHYLDSKRVGGLDKVKRGGSWSGDKFQSDQDYFNSPHEFNAYFQNTAKEIDNRIKMVAQDIQKLLKLNVSLQSLQRELEARIPSDAKNFLKYLPIRFDYEKKLNQVYQRKFLNRLYDYYQKIAIPQRNKIIQQLERHYQTSFREAFDSDTKEVLDLIQHGIKTIQQAFLTKNVTLFQSTFNNIFEYIQNWNQFYQSVMKERIHFSFSKAMVDPTKTNFYKELDNVWRRKIEPMSKKLGLLLFKFHKEFGDK